MGSATIRVGVIMDPIGSISAYKDSTLAMLLAAQKRGWSILYMELNDLYLNDGHARAHMQELTVRDNNDDWFALGSASDEPLGDLDVILMRKDPPFDMEYIYATYILDRAEAGGAMVVNPPQALRDANEKAFTSYFAQCSPPTLISRSKSAFREFADEHKHIVVKPLDGMGGRSVFVVKHDDTNLNVVLETLTDEEHRFAIAQKYIPEIREGGDGRILLIDGVPVPYALARIPAPGDNRGNLAAGARSEGRPLSDRDRWICEQLRPEIQRRGLLFVGLDVIGDYLTEVNVTSPTCIRELDEAYELDIAGQLMDAIEKRLAAR